MSPLDKSTFIFEFISSLRSMRAWCLSYFIFIVHNGALGTMNNHLKWLKPHCLFSVVHTSSWPGNSLPLSLNLAQLAAAKSNMPSL